MSRAAYFFYVYTPQGLRMPAYQTMGDRPHATR